jgi:hypothetical protein
MLVTLKTDCRYDSTAEYLMLRSVLQPSVLQRKDIPIYWQNLLYESALLKLFME